MIKTIEKHYFDANNVELDFGDILQSNSLYPFYDDGNNNYYGLIVWLDDDGIDIRITVGDNNRVNGCSDGNCEYIRTYADDNGVLKDFIKIGSVKNQEDINKYLRDKDWTYNECID